MIRAITFDLWDTIVVDDSDEIARSKKGLDPKPLARLKAISSEVRQHHKGISEEQVILAFNEANRRFNDQWKNKHVTPTLSERLGYVYEELGIAPTPGLAKVVQVIGNMEVEIMPILAPGIEPALKELSKTYRLGIISDAIHTPGSGLRQILKNYKLEHYFSTFIFSDEAGASKPDKKVFELAQKKLGVEFSAIAHIGDRESNDVLGPNKVGMKSILYTGVIDRGAQNTQASALCTHHDQLANIARSL